LESDHETALPFDFATDAPDDPALHGAADTCGIAPEQRAEKNGRQQRQDSPRVEDARQRALGSNPGFARDSGRFRAIHDNS